MEAKTSEWRPGPTVCRCCLTEGCYKDISTEYFWMGKREVYAEMLADTLNLTIAYSQSGGPNSNSRLICEPCISRLRDAADFKRQVLECEKTFLQHLDPSTSGIVAEDVSRESILKGKQVKIELVKLEKLESDDDDFEPSRFTDDDDVDDDIDDQPLTKLAKTPKKETVDLLDLIDNAKVAEKRKSTTKVKATPVKKAKPKKETKTTANQDKPEKKKKGDEENSASQSTSTDNVKWSRKRKLAEENVNAAIILEHSNTVVFRWNRGKFMCAYCPCTYTSVKEIRLHSEDHKNKLDVFFYNPEVRNKYPLRVDITDLCCIICNEKTENLEALKTHLSDVHNKTFNSNNISLVPFVLTNEKYSCVACGKYFETLMALFSHMNEHYSDYVCYTCGKGYSSKHKLQSHQKYHESGEFQCPKCDTVLASRVARDQHVSKVHGSKERYRCPICNEQFSSYYGRLKHLDKTHGKKAEYKCNLCSSVFRCAGLRYSHMKIVHRMKT
ncbi:zinc finger protein 652 isoform X14 [Papilio machaon]|uniref:zinc finger protein 652 isoform X14 n=1 Tax=Papilio machaon TaxID=76193 RepID=UPI0006EB1A40|nr:zinc finger protein 652 isoform X14 [Papilio machaon]